MTSNPHSVVEALAAAFEGSDWSEEDLVERGAHALRKRWRWLRPVVRRLRASFPTQRPSRRAMAACLTRDKGLQRACDKHSVEIGGLQERPPAVIGNARSRQWGLPAWATAADLADSLQLSTRDLDWFADRRSARRQPFGPLRHYRYYWRSKRRKGSARLIEAPKFRLKQIQRCLLGTLLNRIPPHSAAHGFRPGRSALTYVEPHTNSQVVVRLDLRDFFASIPVGRLFGLYRFAGYPEDVVNVLVGLSTTSAPRDVMNNMPEPPHERERERIARLYGEMHVPQGAPTSPALANLCCYRLDQRLTGLAAYWGGTYSRYADDLLFSGGAKLRTGSRSLIVGAAAISQEEGFELNLRKSRVMPTGRRQQAAGLILNARPNVPREDFDRLKAILHNCCQHGPDSQNRDGHPEFQQHLLGRIAFVRAIHPPRGDKLLTLYRRIRWDEPPDLEAGS